MKKMAFVAMLVVSMALTAEAARKGSSGKQPIGNPRQTNDCAAYGCNDDGYSNDGDDQSSNDTHVPSSGTYEGNDRDTGSDYINGMPY